MTIDIIVNIIKVISIVLILIIFSMIIYQYLTIEADNNAKNVNIEKFNQGTDVIDYENQFKYKPYNIRLMYENTGEYPWNRHAINSSIP